jgi:hypothetical protein
VSLPATVTALVTSRTSSVQPVLSGPITGSKILVPSRRGIESPRERQGCCAGCGVFVRERWFLCSEEFSGKADGTPRIL